MLIVGSFIVGPGAFHFRFFFENCYFPKFFYISFLKILYLSFPNNYTQITQGYLHLHAIQAHILQIALVYEFVIHPTVPRFLFGIYCKVSNKGYQTLEKVSKSGRIIWTYIISSIYLEIRYFTKIQNFKCCYFISFNLDLSSKSLPV